MKDMPKVKVPGPDGYTIGFYVKCWPLIKSDLVAAFNSLFNLDSKAFEGLNTAHLVLLPKRRVLLNPMTFAQLVWCIVLPKFSLRSSREDWLQNSINW